MAQTLVEMMADGVYPPAWATLRPELREKLEAISHSMAVVVESLPPDVRLEILIKVRDAVLIHLVRPEVAEWWYVKSPIDPKLMEWALDTTDLEQVERDILDMRKNGGYTIDDIIRDMEEELKKEPPQ